MDQPSPRARPATFAEQRHDLILAAVSPQVTTAFAKLVTASSNTAYDLACRKRQGFRTFPWFFPFCRLSHALSGDRPYDINTILFVFSSPGTSVALMERRRGGGRFIGHNMVSFRARLVRRCAMSAIMAMSACGVI
jgi:hypothetical protein